MIERLDGATQGPYGFVELGIAVQLTKTNPEWLAAVKKRSIACDTKEALELIQIDPWPAGGHAIDKIPEGHRAVAVDAKRPYDVRTSFLPGLRILWNPHFYWRRTGLEMSLYVLFL